MAIRPRITNPYSDDVKQFEKRMKEGPAPKAPRKPTAEERKPLLDALHAVQVGVALTPAEWRNRYVLPSLHKTYDVWGVKLALYPTATLNSKGKHVLTGVLVIQVERNGRGVQPKKQLYGPKRELWYGEIIRWLEDTKYT
jgi:hypothetical protein